MTPLKKARKAKGWTQKAVVERLAAAGFKTDEAKLSRLERGIGRPSAAMAKCLRAVLGKKLTVSHLIFPEDFTGVEVDAGGLEPCA